MDKGKLDHLYQGGVLDFAHRGASHDAPQNTLAAFRLAREMGADGLELDVQVSKDGEAVVIHDFTVDETTDGSGWVRDMTLGQLKDLDAGSWFGPAFAGERIPTLAEVFSAIGERLLVNVELKTTGMRDQGLERTVLALIERHRMEDHVLISSFNPFALRRCKRLAPRVRAGLLVAPDLPLSLRRGWLAAGIVCFSGMPEMASGRNGCRCQ